MKDEKSKKVPNEKSLANLKPFKAGQSGFAGRHHTDISSPLYWKKLFMRKTANRKILKKYIDECRRFFDLPKRWSPNHAELCEAYRLKIFFEEDIPNGNFEYLDKLAERLDGKIGVSPRSNEGTGVSTVIILPPTQPLRPIDSPSARGHLGATIIDVEPQALPDHPIKHDVSGDENEEN